MTTPAAAFSGVSYLLEVEDPGTPGTYRVVGGLKSNGGNISNGQLDTTSKDGDRWATMISGGIQKMTMSASGIFKDDAVSAYIQSLALSNTAAKYRMASANGDTFTGSFFIKTHQRQGSDASPEDYSFSLDSAGTITYVAPAPTAVSVTPATGVAAGGTSVVIVGTKFQLGATVKFGATAATGVVVTDQGNITAVSPAHVAGVVAVVVTNPDGQLATLAASFTYT